MRTIERNAVAATRRLPQVAVFCRLPFSTTSCSPFSSPRFSAYPVPLRHTEAPGAFIDNRSNQPRTLVEKIVQRFSALDGHTQEHVKAGDFVAIRPAHVMTHDNTAAVISKFKSLGAMNFKDPRQAVFTLDHDVQNKSEKNLKKYQLIEHFASLHGVDFYGAGRGIGHQVMIEEGYAFPYTLTVASDSHSNMYGGIGALGTPVVRTDAAAIWATGQTWWQIPPIAEVILDGRLPVGCSGKDVIVTLCGAFHSDEVLNMALEFKGDGIRHLTVDDRLAIANMTTEWGALAGVFPVDELTISWLRRRCTRLSPDHRRINSARIDWIENNPLRADPVAHYAKRLSLDLSTLSPSVSGPNSVKIINSARTLRERNVAIHKAYLVSCVNSRAADIRSAAEVVRGRKVHPNVEFYIAPASSEVLKEASETGDWQELIRAGAKPLPAGCGPCIGLGVGLLQDGETGISATNRNFKGRMGSPKADAYLASPAVVAASAVAGKICEPSALVDGDDAFATSSDGVRDALKVSLKEHPVSEQGLATEVQLIPGFPESVTGDIVFCHADNLNTDAIYPGKYTYQDDMSFEDMGRVVMENYDKAFAETVKKGDILVGGFNFGTGSSREQAATALISAGVRLVIAGSFSETFKRNAFNNGLAALECPDLARELKAAFGAANPTVRTGISAKLSFARGCVETFGWKGSFRIPRLGRVVQEILVEGGLENWVRRRATTGGMAGLEGAAPGVVNSLR